MGFNSRQMAILEETATADESLVKTIKSSLASGDHSGACLRFEEIVATHQQRALKIAYYYLRNPADVEEVVQDAFLKAFLHLPSFREELVFKLWFTKIVINACLDRIKANKRRSRWMIPTDDKQHERLLRHPSSEPSPERVLFVDERSAELRMAVIKLPERQRAVVVLNVFQGHSTKEVSQALGLSEATVRVHLFRAIQSLRKLIGRRNWLRAPLLERDEGALA